MYYISFEVNPGRLYKAANFVRSFSIPRPNVTLGRRERPVDPYREKVERVKSEVFELLRGEEPFQGLYERGSTAGLGLSRLPVEITLDFSEEASDGLVDKIRAIENVTNVKVSDGDLTRQESVPEY